jgi:hypothetical protein
MRSPTSSEPVTKLRWPVEKLSKTTGCLDAAQPGKIVELPKAA